MINTICVNKLKDNFETRILLADLIYTCDESKIRFLNQFKFNNRFTFFIVEIVFAFSLQMFFMFLICLFLYNVLIYSKFWGY